ncbi:MAG: hypothetical protein HW375_2421 [Anaerolineales bacterium]|nr:hypothetical protein [Anaerolineales bacterium]
MSSVRQSVLSILRFDRLWLLPVGAGFALLVFLSQNRVVGWEPGYNELQPGHHGWVSSHTLAVIAHATPANGFVGYALTSIDREGRMDYEYFDRYPVFFSAGMHALLSWKTRLSTQIYLAKQAMNGIFLLTLAAAYLVLRQLSLSPVRSLTAAVLAVSSPYLLFYKDMVHYDQPAVLGMLLLVLAIAWTKVNGRRYFVVGATLLAVSLGRGYASLVILLVWLVLEAIEVLQRKAPFSPDKVRALLSLTSLRAAILGTVWAGLNLAYNIHVEATRRGVALLQTGIVASAVDRLALNQDFNASYAGLLGWRYFVSDELIRLVRWSFPIWEYEGSWVVSALIVIAMVGVIVVWGRSMDPARRQVLAILTVSGPIWLFAMRNLSAFHDYTAMYFLGIPLAFFGACAYFLRLPRFGWILALMLSLAVFTARNLQIQDLHRDLGRPYDVYTHDFMRMADALPSSGQSIYVVDGVPFAPFAFGFYLPDQVLAPQETAAFAIGRDPELRPTNLTPENSRLFLFENR